MSRTIHLRAKAESDMEELADYLATFDELLRFPGLGRARDYRNPRLKGMRMRPTLGYNNYLVFYLPTDDGIEIVRVLHSSRNIEALFTESDE